MGDGWGDFEGTMTGRKDLCAVCSMGLKCGSQAGLALRKPHLDTWIDTGDQRGVVVHSTKGFFTYKRTCSSISLKDEG